MLRKILRVNVLSLGIICILVLSALNFLYAAEQDEKARARQILEATGVKGGLIVHLGCGDGKLTAALRANDSYMVHGLDPDAKNVQKARKYIQSLGIYGSVSVEQWTGDRLPYIDNLVNLLVAENLGKTSMDEVKRVLVPNGVAYIKEGGKWTKTIKPRPAEIDEWTHYLHDASNNAVAHDSVVGPPRHLQWVGTPKWSRHHDRMASMSALVSSNGRIFYIMDEGSRVSIELPPKWSLFARDAFNGTILWKRSISSWYPHLWPFKSGHAQLPRRLVAVGDTVYVTLSLDAPLTALDAATGQTIRTYEGSKATEEVIASDGVLFLLVNETPVDYSNFKPINRNIGQAKKRVAREWPWNAKKRRVMAVQAETGKSLWRKQYSVAPLTLAADRERLIFHDGEKVVCLNRKTGDEVWSSEPVGRRSPITTNFGPTLVVYQDVVLFAGGDRSMTALSAKTGKTLWKAKHHRGGHNSPEDLLVVGGLVWSGAVAGGRDSGVFTGLDLKTGKVKSEFTPDVKTYWFHHRCYRAKATDKYLLPSRTGIEFVDFQNKHWEAHHWVRGGCIYGIMPCNGLVYAPPHDCACYLISKLYGFNALAPESPTRQTPREIPDDARLERGPAYGIQIPTSQSQLRDEWSTYRHDPARSGRTKASVPTNLKRSWQTDLGDKLSSIVVAGGKLFVAPVDTHTVIALDASSGETLWTYTTGGRVDSPPTIYQGRALFGSADGWVYCLRASDGDLIWRFRAAPEDRRLTAFDQLESVWPVHGSVLVQDDVAQCLAGRSLFLDGGMRLLRLDPRTGSKLSETLLDDRDPETGENLQVKVKGLNMPTALPDVLSSDGKYVYMRAQRFDLQGNRQQVVTPSDPAHQEGEVAHLFSSIGFLDGSWFHRGYWVYGRTVLSGAGGYYRAGWVVPAGRILTFDDSSVYGYGRKPEYFRWTTPLEYHLFATSKEPPQAQKPARRRGGSEIKTPKSKSLNPANKPLTVEAWVKAEKKDGVVVARGGGSHGYSLFLKGGKPRFAIRVANKLNSVGAKENIVGKWVHLAGVLTDDKKLHVYVNGKRAGSAEASGFIVSDPAQAMQIGSDDGNAAGDYKSPFGLAGVIDEVRIYHRALSADEISKHYSTPAQAPQDKALVLYYSFDEGDAVDASGKKNNGEVVGAQSVEGKFGKAMKFTGTRARRGRSIVKFRWSQEIPFYVRAMVLSDKTLFIAGPPDVMDEEKVFDAYGDEKTRAKLKEQVAALKGERGASLWAVSASDGKKLAEYKLESVPAWDAMAAANGRLYVATTDGKVICMSGGR